MERPTKEQIKTLPLYPGLSLDDIVVVEDDQAAAEALQCLRHETSLGFDTESKPTFRKGEVSRGPTLIQLSTASKAFLFPTRFPCAVAAASEILSDPKIKKVGFGLKGDKKELSAKFNINISNTEDLAVKLKHLAAEKNTIGARAAVAMVLKFRLGKGAQQSNWGAYPLRQSQILYAANDAHSAICIEQVISAMTHNK